MPNVNPQLTSLDSYRAFQVSDTTLYALGFKRFWRSSLCAFFPQRDIVFISHISKAPKNGLVAVWGATILTNEDEKKLIQANELRLLRLEDGFIRSVGLGAEFTRPLSWIADSKTPYFNATQPSDLETCLAQHDFSDRERNQGKALLEQLVTANISKYNVQAGKSWQPQPQARQKVILIAGQVEADASIKLGALGIRTNLELVNAVRAEYPDDYLVYKPHPDVVAKARAEGSDEQQAFAIADEIVTNVAIEQMYGQIDELHCITSLAGFEALIRGVEVHCWGGPFYAGWGLTNDHWPLATEHALTSELQRRRSIKRTLEELAYATLHAYPLYLLGSAKATLQALEQQKSQPKSVGKQLEIRFKRRVRQILNWLHDGAG